MNPRSVAAILACLLSFGIGSAAPADDVIARARAYLGAERALEAVRSIHFTGTLELTAQVPSEADPSVTVDQQLRLPVDIVFQKPYQQRIVVRSEKVIETSALDDYDGWQRRSDAQDPSRSQVVPLDPQQVKRLRANTWENLSFFRGLERRGGRVEYQGEATADGVACAKIAFIHGENIVFYRFFDRTTGRLVKTETESGGEIREEGEMTVSGVRFPRKVINKTPDGKTTTITFEKVVINEVHPASDFAYPTLSAP
ncbi:MAG TPA: hypothetical protein VEB22_01615 [Phycisphaerales bacterium]|nr:hypothetical protein [Phycisphaerales bacterium]